MGNGENWDGEHYFGYLDTVSHLNDAPGKSGGGKQKREPTAIDKLAAKLLPWALLVLGIEFVLYVLYQILKALFPYLIP